MCKNLGFVLTSYILIKCKLILCIIKLFSNQELALTTIITNIRLKVPNVCTRHLFTLYILRIDT